MINNVLVKAVGIHPFCGIQPGNRGMVDADKYNIPAAIAGGQIKLVRVRKVTPDVSSTPTH